MMMVSANAGALASAARVKGMSKSARTARDMRTMAVVLRAAALEGEGGLSVKRSGVENPSLNKSLTSRRDGSAGARAFNGQASRFAC
jgi:hypothetical protein